VTTPHPPEPAGSVPDPSVRERAPTPAARDRITDLYFLEHRAKLLDLASFLDRLDRSPGAPDHRERAIRRAMSVLTLPGPGRARRVLELLSDPTTEPADNAPGKGADGAWAAPSEPPGNHDSTSGTDT